MSEFEKLQRSQYKRNRKKRITALTALLVVFVLIFVGTFHLYNQLNQTYYIHYSESGKIDYTVALRENDFYEDPVQSGNRAYIAALIDQLNADVRYRMDMDAQSVAFDYQYRIDARVIIQDKPSGEVIFDPVYPLKPEQTVSGSQGSGFVIAEQIAVDYQKYDAVAKEFIQVYGLKDVNSTLSVMLTVDVTSHCADFENSNENTYCVALELPLNQSTVTAQTSASAPDGQSKILACSGGGMQGVAKAVCIVSAVFSILTAGGLIGFIYLTRNDDINYTIKVKRLVNSYRSFIQQVENGFDSAGYQLVRIKTFPEMLGIRDTLQAPILMSENEDQTCTQFFIPTNTKLLYIFEIKVDNYDQIYGKTQETSAV